MRLRSNNNKCPEFTMIGQIFLQYSKCSKFHLDSKPPKYEEPFVTNIGSKKLTERKISVLTSQQWVRLLPQFFSFSSTLARDILYDATKLYHPNYIMKFHSKRKFILVLNVNGKTSLWAAERFKLHIQTFKKVRY